MSKANDGGPAFGQVVDLHCVRVDPCGATEWEPAIGASGGLTVRDYFAAKAMQYVLGCSWPDLELSPINGLTPVENSARFAYDIADAMLKARAA